MTAKTGRRLGEMNLDFQEFLEPELTIRGRLIQITMFLATSPSLCVISRDFHLSHML